MAEVITVDKLPNCSFCGEPARYDTQTVFGSWAYACGVCWLEFGVGRLGTGFGQMLVVKQ